LEACGTGGGFGEAFGAFLVSSWRFCGWRWAIGCEIGACRGCGAIEGACGCGGAALGIDIGAARVAETCETVITSPPTVVSDAPSSDDDDATEKSSKAASTCNSIDTK
jgi:hypothetical protein